MAKNKIPANQIPFAYEVAKKVFEGKIRLKDAKAKLVDRFGMNQNSAADFVYVFKYLNQGVEYQRGLSAYATEYFINGIYNDYGPKALELALQSLKLNMEYQRKKEGSKIRLVYDKLFAMLNLNSLQDRIVEEFLKLDNPKQQAIEYLTNHRFESKRMNVKLSKYSRNNVAIACIKLIRGFKCQLCGYKLKKSDGRYYIEAAHIDSKSIGGKEISENIILLCPNHHKEFDLKDRKIIERSSSKLKFSMGEKTYEVKF